MAFRVLQKKTGGDEVLVLVPPRHSAPEYLLKKEKDP